ncbi:MAG: hypothetical protein AB7E79_04330 [Rhodospirillaceae bacterium]
MMDTRSKWERYATAVLVAAPVVSLLLGGIAFLHYGIDLPFYDDFRAYARRTALSLDPRDLFAPANDTLYAVGMALDVIAQRTLNGNAVAYQFISMMVLLGGLLWMQWRLLSSTLQDRLLAAAAFSTCIFLTWPESYWGLQSMAYHHGLPLFFLLGALTAVVARRWADWWGVPLVFLLGLLAGFSYISGAIASLAVAVVLVIAWALGLPRVPGLRGGAFALLASASITVPAQLWVVLSVQRGHIHDPATAWLLPTESGFWMFMLGKVARGLALPIGWPVLSLIATLSVIAIAASVGVYLGRRFWRERGALPEDVARVALIFFSVTAAIASYLPLIAAGRANNLAPNPKTPLAMFIHGMPEHYHSVWVTLAFPWIAAGIIVAIRQWPALPRIRTSPITPLVALALFALAAEAGAFSHDAHFRTVQTFRLRNDVPCIQKALAEDVMACPEWYAPEHLDVLRYGRQIGASFVRTFPLRPIPFGVDNPPPLFRLAVNREMLKLGTLTPEHTDEGMAFPASSDSMFVISFPTGSLGACWEVEVNLELKAERPDFAELFTLLPGQGGYKAPSVATAPVRGDFFTTVTLRALNITGFQDELRIDPVANAQSFTVRNLEVRCRGRVPGQIG